VTAIDDPALLQEEIDASGLKLLGVVPYDAQLAEFDLYGKPIVELPEDSLAVQAVNNFCEKIF